MKTWITGLRVLLVLTVLTGGVYPILVTGLAKLAWPFKASGSFVEKNGEIKGSLLIAQKFEKESYFWPRPSSVDYNAAASGGSNLGPTSADLQKNYQERAKAGLSNDFLFSSGSGLDPHISPQAARIQMDRVVSARGFTVAQRNDLTKIVDESIEDRDFGFLGEPRVNVLKLNLEMDHHFLNKEP